MYDPTVQEERALAPAERAAFPSLAMFESYARASRPGTTLSFVTVRSGSRIAAVAPVVRLARERVTDLVGSTALRRAGRLGGPFVRRSIVLLDTAFRAYDVAAPLLYTPGAHEADLRRTVLAHLCTQGEADAVWIAEPADEAPIAEETEDLITFGTLPMVQVRLEGAASLAEHLRRLSKKRRRNHRREQERFCGAGAEITEHEAPLPPDLLDAAHLCLEASARRSTLHVPYAEVLNDRDAFARQEQTVLVARIGHDVIGFFSMVQRGRAMLQTHGGLDYERSVEASAYHNLTYAAIALAARRGCDVLGLGPLNNETKRRLGTHLVPMTASLWCRRRSDRFLMRRFVVPRLQVYAGSA